MFSNKSNQFILGSNLNANGFNILAFDFRAHGDSDGQLCSFGDRERNDVLGAVRWLRRHRSAESQKIFGLGVSTGGAALLAAAAEPTDEGRAIDAVAVISTYDSFAKETNDLSRYFLVPPIGWLARSVGIPLASFHVGTDLQAFSPAEATEHLAPRPLMVVHGRSDSIIPFQRGLKLYEKAQVPKIRLWVGELNADHEYVIRKNAKYRVSDKEKGELQLQPPDGPSADHKSILYDYDEGLKAITLFFMSAKQVV
jgi:dipeptidyl aminopeptidase/acylaminoacyl peptidase